MSEVTRLAGELASYRAQLAQVEALLLGHAGDAALMALRADMQKLIAVTERSLEEATRAAAPTGSSAPSASIAHDHPATTAATTTHGPSSSIADMLSAAVSSTSASSNISTLVPPPPPPPPPPHPAALITSAPVAHSSSSAAFVTATSASPASAAAAALLRARQKVEGLQPVGDATGRTAYYPGTVTSVRPDGLATVRFIGVPGGKGNDVLVDAAALRPLSLQADAPGPQEVHAGTRVLAKWAVDGQWYNARVDDIVSLDSIRVTFVEYGNVEIVPREWLRKQQQQQQQQQQPAATAVPVLMPYGTVQAAPSSAPSAATRGPAGAGAGAGVGAGAGAGAGAQADEDEAEVKPGTYDGLVIPENLRILPTDTDAERLRKQKRVKAIKFAWRQKKADDAAAAKASSWQAFLNSKGTKRPGEGAGAGPGSGGGGLDKRQRM
jgi:hypothetical protein